MVCVSKTVLLMHGLLAFVVGAERSRSTGGIALKKDGDGPNDAAADVARIFSDKSNLICGGTEIRSLLTDNPSLAKIRCNSWTTIEAQATSYLKGAAVRIADLMRDVDRINKDIEIAKKRSAPKMWAVEEAMPVLKKSLEEAFNGNVDNAIQTKCGADNKKRRALGVQRRPYREFKDICTAALGWVFNGQVRTTGEGLQENCNLLLNLEASAQASDDGSYCDEVCSHFVQEAQRLSDESVGHYAGLAVQQLEKDLRDATTKLRLEVHEQGECERASASLRAFTEQLETLNKDIAVRLDASMTAKDKLDDAEDELDNLSDDAEELTELATKAAQDLLDKTARVNELTTLLSEAKNTEKQRKNAEELAKNALQESVDDLNKANAASAAVDEIKGLVTQTMLLMWAYYQAAVVTPVHNLGLDFDTDIQQYFLSSNEDTQEKKDVMDTLLKMDSYCEKTAKPAFEKMKSTVDLMPLCEFGKVKEMADNVDAMVDSRRTDVKSALENVQSWLNPYRASEQDIKQHGHMSKFEMEQEAINANDKYAKGEPKGLREIVGVFSQSSYYSGYLKHWKLNAKPSFLDLLLQMKEAVDKLVASTADLDQKMQDAVAAHRAQIDVRKRTTALLADALNKNQIAKGKDAEARTNLEAQEKLISNAEADLEELRRKYKEAVRMYEAAKKLLAETHRRGTALLQMVEASDDTITDQAQLAQ